MISINQPIILASQSPRRKELLSRVFGNVRILVIESDETVPPDTLPSKAASAIALRKMEIAKSVVQENCIIITADTIVSFNDRILGKPAGKDEAFSMLKLLSANTHQVFTGYSVYDIESSRQITGVEETRVTFNCLSEQDINSYVASGSPLDKAGGYGIQDAFGSIFVQSIKGCYYNVMGLPISKIYNVIKQINYDRKS